MSWGGGGVDGSVSRADSGCSLPGSGVTSGLAIAMPAVVLETELVMETPLDDSSEQLPTGMRSKKYGHPTMKR